MLSSPCPGAAERGARNPEDGSLVLIENQLEQTDHSCLGQILTYLLGLDAQFVVWIAREFREPHLSAIHWLNEHTLPPPPPIEPLFGVLAGDVLEDLLVQGVGCFRRQQISPEGLAREGC